MTTSTNIRLRGTLEFDPDHLTGKHERQADWKLMGMLVFPGEDHKYYEWFIRKRYRIDGFTKPLRKPHVSYINDAIWEMPWDRAHSRRVWDEYKAKYSGMELEVELDLDVRTNSTYWWLNVTEDSRRVLHSMRKEVGLRERPYFGLHMTVATANEKSIAASRYAHEEVIKKYGPNGR